MFKSYFRMYVIVLFSLVFLSSCSSKPPILNTTLPLVNKTSSGYINLNTFYQQFLNSSQVHIFDDVNNKLIKEKVYSSALGSMCYKLSLSSKQLINNRLYTVCRSKDLWQLVPDILNKKTASHLLITQ